MYLEFVTTFEPNQYILSPTLFNNIYKGALGEVVGCWTIKKEISPVHSPDNKLRMYVFARSALRLFFADRATLSRGFVEKRTTE